MARQHGDLRFDRSGYCDQRTAAHDYKLPGFVDGGPYPGVTRGIYVDQAQLEDTFLKRNEFMRQTKTPIWIGEFGPMFPADMKTPDDQFRMLQDQLDIYNAHGASWSLWRTRTWAARTLVSAKQDSAWLKLLRPITEKKIRLGDDSWGGTDVGIRDIMGPIEKVFKKEYPDFNPFPFGKESWISTLVRSIVLAEPMTKDFERLFENIVEDDTVATLADSFQFVRCDKRERLAEVVAQAAHASFFLASQ